jgi:hypothetical protein
VQHQKIGFEDERLVERQRRIVVAINLVSLITQFLTPDLIGRIATALGLDRNMAQSAISAAVPGLLAGFTGAAAKPGGAENLVDAIKQQSGVLDSFAKTIGSSGQSSLIDTGSRLLTSLLGGQDQSALAGAVAKFSGLTQSAGGSLLGILAPVVMGTIGKHLGARNLDANSLASLLNTQKDQIAQALPSGFSSLLRGTHLLDSVGEVAKTATAAAGQGTRAAAAATDCRHSRSTCCGRGNICDTGVALLVGSPRHPRRSSLVPAQ